ncbi:unnamed protein product, partial [Ostreobium quekettii]
MHHYVKQSTLATSSEIPKRLNQRLQELTEKDSLLGESSRHVLAQIQSNVFSVVEGQSTLERGVESEPSTLRMFGRRLLMKALAALVTDVPVLLVGACITSLVPHSTVVAFKVMVPNNERVDIEDFVVRARSEFHRDEFLTQYRPEITTSSLNITEHVTFADAVRTASSSSLRE